GERWTTPLGSFSKPLKLSSARGSLSPKSQARRRSAGRRNRHPCSAAAFRRPSQGPQPTPRPWSPLGFTLGSRQSAERSGFTPQKKIERMRLYVARERGNGQRVWLGPAAASDTALTG